MKSIIIAAALALGITGASASAQDAQDAQGAEATPKEEKKICRTDKSTGSLTRRTRVCMTAAQWREFNGRTFRGVSEMQGQGSGSQAIANNAGAGG